MTDKPEFVLGVDLDGVCADFYGTLRPLAAEWLGVDLKTLTPDVSYNLPEWGFMPGKSYVRFHRWAVTQRHLFGAMTPIHGAAPALRRLSVRGLRIRIITHRLYLPHFHQQAVQQTVEWLDNHGFPFWDLCFMRDKGAVGADVYIEDAPGNIEQLRAQKNDVIAYTNSTNRDVPGPRADTWPDVERLVLERVEAWERVYGPLVSGERDADEAGGRLSTPNEED